MEFAALRLYDVQKVAAVIKDLYEKGLISRSSYLGVVGYDFENEVHDIDREREVLKEYDIPEFAPQPFTPQPTTPGNNQAPTEEE